MNIENSNEAISKPMMRKIKPIAETINPGRWIGCGGVFCTEVAIVYSIARRQVDAATAPAEYVFGESKPVARQGYPT